MTAGKTFYKVVSWRLISVIITMIIMVLLTGNVKEASGMTISLHAVLTVSHYIFEKIWNNMESKE